MVSFIYRYIFVSILNDDVLKSNYKKFLIFLLIFNVFDSFSQICSDPTIVSTTGNNFCERLASVSYLDVDDGILNKDFEFNSFSKYTRGITMGGSTILKLTVKTSSTSASTCRWKLVMCIDNMDYALSETEWETIDTYGTGTGSNKPPIDQLMVRVTNGCQDPITNGSWETYAADHDCIDIVNSTIDTNPDNAITCTSTPAVGQQVNGPGTYMGVDYSEFTFNIDYRIRPGYQYIPGIYKLRVHFCLVEK